MFKHCMSFQKGSNNTVESYLIKAKDLNRSLSASLSLCLSLTHMLQKELEHLKNYLRETK